MANRKSNSGKTEIKKTITPIGIDVPKDGIAINPNSAKELSGKAEERAGIHKWAKLTKEDGFEPKIGPKQILQKMDPKVNIQLDSKISGEK